MSTLYPIDFVIPWVDDSDPVWRAKKAQYTGVAASEGNEDARYRDWDTLKYWFRGVEKFAPWVRYIYFVTDNQKPEWLNVEHPKLKWVKHTDFIPEEYLPTFNSNVIELNLHRIDDLAEHFILRQRQKAGCSNNFIIPDNHSSVMKRSVRDGRKQDPCRAHRAEGAQEAAYGSRGYGPGKG